MLDEMLDLKYYIIEVLDLPKQKTTETENKISARLDTLNKISFQLSCSISATWAPQSGLCTSETFLPVLIVSLFPLNR